MQCVELRSLTQPCLTAHCIMISLDSDISPGSANQCVFRDVYLRSNLSKKLFQARTWMWNFICSLGSALDSERGPIC